MSSFNRSFNVYKDKYVFLTDKMFDKKYFCNACVCLSKLLNISDKDFIKLLVNINSFYAYLNLGKFKKYLHIINERFSHTHQTPHNNLYISYLSPNKHLIFHLLRVLFSLFIFILYFCTFF